MLEIKDSILKIKGIGPKKFKSFDKLNISTIKDLLYYFPRDYENRGEIKKIASLVHDEKSTIIARICGNPRQYISVKKNRVIKYPITDESGKGYVVFFNGDYFKRALQVDKTYIFYGKVSIIKDEVHIIHPEFSLYDEEKADFNFTGIIPIYKVTKGITQKEISNLIHRLLIDEPIEIKEYLPLQIIEKNKLCDINYALRNIHFPSSKYALDMARYRLIFEELFFLQIGLLLIKSKNFQPGKGIKFEIPKEFYKVFQNIPYELTKAQKRVLKEIISDVTSGKTMNRLVQGDVGSGKTIISLLTMYIAHLNGYQSALMVPTEILAEQHYETFKKILKPFDVKIALLTSNVTNKEQVLSSIKDGNTSIVIGTHAIIQDSISFKNLGIVITDEQHRFGVRQRSFLSKKGLNPHVLIMSATPIPRTLSLVLYGDIDISIIDELPPGRKFVKTYIVPKKKIDRMYKFIKEEIEKGKQAYIICPLIEDSDKIKSTSAVSMFNKLSNTYFKGIKLGLIHGKMPPQEKDRIMNEFKDNKIKILVSTTVIEVGIDVPNSTIIVIEGAERFGLSQLHQLRGRVGRGKEQSYCFLISYSTSEITKKRLKVLTETNDGFVIAEKDLELRGPGDFFGTKQHGLPELKIANLLIHTKIMKKAQNEAINYLKNYTVDENLLNTIKEYLGLAQDSIIL